MFDIIILCIMVLLLVFAFIGARRGGIRSGIKFGLAVASALLAFFLAQPIANFIMSLDAFSFELSSGATAANLNDYIMGLLTAEQSVADIINSSPAIQSLIAQIPVALVSVILFLLAYFVFKLILGFVYLIVVPIVLPKKDEDGNKKKTSYFAGLGFSIARALVTVAVILIPVAGLLGAVTTAYPELKNAEIIDSEVAEIADGYVDGYKSSITYAVANAVNVDAAFNKLSEIKMTDGTKTSLFVEVNKLLPVAGELMKLTNIDTSNLKSEDIGIIADMMTNLGDSDIAAELLAGIMKDTADAVINRNEVKLGIDLNAMDPATGDLMKDVLGVFIDSNSANMKEDMVVLGGCFEIIADAGLIEAASGENGKLNVNELLNCITEKTENEEDSTFVENLFAKLSESDRLGKLTGSLTNYGIYQGTTAMGIPYDKKEVHDTMITDLGTTLTDNKVSEIDMAKVYAEIERQAAPAVVMARLTNAGVPVLAITGPLYNSDGEDDDNYQRFMAAFMDIISAVDNAGVEYTGEIIAYTILTVTYAYNTESESWTLAGEDEQVSVAAALAQKVLEIASEPKGEDDAVFTNEDVAEVLAIVVTNTDSETDAELSNLAGKLADEESFETNKTTFKDNMAIKVENISKEDVKDLASAVVSIVEVAQKVTNTETEGGEASGNITNIIDGETLKDIGAALDKIDSIGSIPDNFSANLLQGVVDNLGDDESSKPIKDTLTNVIDGVKDPNKNVNFEDMLGGVGDASSAILGLLDYIDAKNKGEEPDRNAAIDKLATGLEGIRGMKEDALTLLKDSLLSNVQDMMPADSKSVSELLTTLIDKIADYEPAEADHDFKPDADALIDLYEFLTEEKGEATAYESLSDIITKIETSDLVSFVSTDIIKNFANSILDINTQASYLGIVIADDGIFTKDYLDNGMATKKGDRFVVEFFSVLASDEFGTNAKANLEVAKSILDTFVGVSGASFAETVENAAAAGIKLPELSGTSFAELASIYAE